MGRARRCVAAAAIACCAGPAFGITQLLMQDLGIKGTVHLCKYTDNNVYSVDATERCPLQFDDDPQPLTSPRGPSGQCFGYSGPGGACYTGPGGGLYSGPGGGLYTGPGGGLYAGPGGGLYAGPGGGMYAGPGGGLYAGPGGGLYAGPGGGIYGGPPSNEEGSYKGPWGPCITGAATEEWLRENCPNRR